MIKGYVDMQLLFNNNKIHCELAAEKKEHNNNCDR